MTRKVRRAGMGLVAAAMLAAGLAGSPAATAAPGAPPLPQGKPNMPEEVLAVYRENNPDVPVDVLYARLMLSSSRKALLAKFGAEYGGTFAGSWYDFREGVWYLQATDEATTTAMANAARAHNIVPRTRLVEFSLNQLDARAERIRAGKDPMSRIGRRAGFDVKANRVTLVAPPERRTVHDAMVDYVERPTPPRQDDACSSRRACGAPLRSGVILWTGNEQNPQCSLGFVFSATDGTRWAVTAGHCVLDPAAQWGHGQQAFGLMHQCAKEGPSSLCVPNQLVDVARMKIGNQYWLTYGFGYIFSTPLSAAQVDNAITSEDQIEVGDAVCYHGWHRDYTGFTSGYFSQTTRQPCGEISAVSGEEWGMPMVSGAEPCPGDSGGGWTFLDENHDHWAYGVNKNTYKTQGKAPYPCGNGNGSWFSSIPDINAFFDAYSAATIRVMTR